MAGLNMFPIMVILLLANCALPTLAYLDDLPSVVECKKHFSIKYAFDVYNYVFKGKKIGDFSCRALVTLGRPCHNVFVNNTFTYEHTGNRTAIQARADRLHCILMCNVTSHIAQGRGSYKAYITRPFRSSLSSGSIGTPKLSEFVRKQSHDG
ncbi:hypothetical protein DVH24_004007 [Malus domestica]|uniref:Prolamin-like domain-containing protein n=1 Tax=Malus domestica TaxID=3750 RepID=A0A498KC27_MALDO|nr:hypothetical protein DVH24_004007 [Malus domestica]